MLILGIDEATADTGLYVNQVEFDDTGDIAPVFLVETEVCALHLLCGQLQIHT